MPTRRHLLMAAGTWPLALGPGSAAGQAPARGPGEGPGKGPGEVLAPDGSQGVRRGQALRFPADHGAHLQTRTEWWYVTGWLGTPEVPTHGFQITFFRSRTGLAQGNPSRFAARHLLFAHAAVTQLQPRLHAHGQRIVRWSGAEDAPRGRALGGQGDVSLADWSLRDDGRGWQASAGWPQDRGGARVAAGEGPGMDLALQRTQPLLLQGDAGYSRKGPLEHQASHYYSEPQLAASGAVSLPGAGARTALSGRAWMDHEWSDEYLAPGAVGWDWIGINLFDGSALTAFVLRRADGTVLWAGGSHRSPDRPSTAFGAGDVRFIAGRRWRSPSTGALYPVDNRVETPAGTFQVRALMDEQELDSRASTGTVYWEGLSELLDLQGRRLGLGYLELTGYAGALKM